MKKNRYLFIYLISFALLACAKGPVDLQAPPASSGSPQTQAQTPAPGSVTKPKWTAVAKPTGHESDSRVSCRQLARRAEQFQIQRLIVVFEGLGSFDSAGTQALYRLFDQDRHLREPSGWNSKAAGYVLRGLLYPLLLKSEGRTEFLVFPHHSVTDENGGSVEACLIAWLQSSPQTKIMIIGHSYGGHAANQLARRLEARHIEVDSVVTLDPRTKFYSGSLGRTQNVRNWLNFYQLNTAFLKGYAVPGADLNQNLSSTGASHFNLPELPTIHNRVRTLLGLANKGN